MGFVTSERDGLVEWFALTIDCADAGVLADFYVAALGGEVTRRERESVHACAGGLTMVFRSVLDYQAPTWPSPQVPLQVHFELVVGDLDSAVGDFERLGARRAAHQDDTDPHLVVMVDPAGRPFCVIRDSAATQP